MRDDLGGMLEAGERLGVELVPTFSATTEPSGTISRAAFERMRDELLAGLRAAGADSTLSALRCTAPA